MSKSMTPDQYNTLVKKLDESGDTIKRVFNADKADLIAENTEELITYAINNLPKKVYLHYVDYRDELSIKQVATLVDKGRDELWEDLWEWTADQEYDAIKQELSNALPGLDSNLVDELVDNDEYERFREACWERNDSDVSEDLMRNTGRVMFRINLEACSRRENLDTNCSESSIETDRDYYFPSTTWESAERIDELAEELLACLLADPDHDAGKPSSYSKKEKWTNLEQAGEIIVNACYGGSPTLLLYLDVQDLVGAIDKVRYRADADKRAITMTIKNPNFLIYDGLNGSGYEDTIFGNFRLTIPVKNIPDAFYVDHKDAGTGYSWSEDIAGVVKSYFTCDPDYGYDPPLPVEETQEAT